MALQKAFSSEEQKTALPRLTGEVWGILWFCAVCDETLSMKQNSVSFGTTNTIKYLRRYSPLKMSNLVQLANNKYKVYRFQESSKDANLKKL